VASPDDIVALIGRMSHLDDAVAAVVEEEEEDLVPAFEIHETADDAPVVKLVTSIVAQAVEDGASDVHFEPEDRDMRVRFRIDGVLHETTSVPRRMIAGVVSRVKIMGNLDIAERRVPQDGRTGLMVEGRSVDIRIVTMPSVRGEGLVLRLLTKEAGMMSLDKLGMGESARERFEAGFRQAFGAVLVTGPTGSGKSTTLYAALNSINSVERNVITVEDPVEYRLPGLNQLQVNYKAGLTFPAALRAMLRADPDVIMVGEIRDSETAQIAIEAALTGHLVLSTLHTNDAPSAIARLTEMRIEPFLIASAVDCVLAQRLARTLCTHCKRRACMTVEALRAAGFAADFELECYEPVGCERCNGTGYRGRTGVYEVMPLSDEIRALALARSSADEVKAVARSQGMGSLREDGLEKVKHGLTSIAEIARVT
jgi:type IV pilus assembly protein PilB